MGNGSRRWLTTGKPSRHSTMRHRRRLSPAVCVWKMFPLRCAGHASFRVSKNFASSCPPDFVHRARWVMADTTLTDAELTYLATGELGTEGHMSAYRDALSISADSSDQRLELAAEILAAGTGVVMFNDTVALRPTRTCLLCEVVDPAPSSRRCENEFEVLVENARTMLDSSRLRQRLPNIPRKWLVVEDYGTGTAELWRAP